MGASFSDRFYIAAPQGVAVKLSDMLSSAQIIPSGVVHTGDEAVRAAKDGAAADDVPTAGYDRRGVGQPAGRGRRCGDDRSAGL